MLPLDYRAPLLLVASYDMQEATAGQFYPRTCSGKYIYIYIIMAICGVHVSSGISHYYMRNSRIYIVYKYIYKKLLCVYWPEKSVRGKNRTRNKSEMVE